MTIQLRRDTAANWTSADPTLAAGELGLESDTTRMKVGDGSTVWTSLAYAFESVNLVGDMTPQLGGMLDVNGQAFGDGTLELLDFAETASAVDHLRVTNAATGGSPSLSAVGDDTNISLTLAAKGTGVVKGALVPLAFAISDESTALTTGTAKLTYYMPRAFTIKEIYACVTTAPTGANLIIDVNDGGTSIMTTNKLTIEATEFSTTTATTGPTLTDTALAAGTALTFDIDQIGSTVAGAGAKVTLLGYWT